MRRKHIKFIIVMVFLSLILRQSAYCAIDIAEFKKLKNVKTILHKSPETKKNKTPKSLKIEEAPLDTSVFSQFEESEYDMTSDPFEKTDKFEHVNNSQETPKNSKKSSKKEKKINFKNPFKNPFKKKEKDLSPSLEDENINENDIITPDDDILKQGTYIPDDGLVYIKEVEIYGNNLLNTNYIKDVIKSKEGMQYVRSNVSSDLKALWSTGYFTQNLRALPIKIDNNNVKLRIILEENPPIAGFNLIGCNSIPKSEVMNILNEYKGMPQNILNINTAINKIQDLYSSKGYILARVSKVDDDPDGYINVIIDEGIIGDIIVDGNNKTRDFIVKRNIFLQTGSVYNENTMRSDILRLMGTQAFKDVQRELKKDETTGLYDVYIALEEQRTGKISLGVGIDSASGFFGSVGFSENNFRGLNQKLNLNLLAGTGILMNDSSVAQKANLQGEISFLEPMFKRENQSLAVRGFARYYGSYQVPLAIEKRFGGEFTLARKFTAYKNLSGSIGLGVESVTLDEGDETTMRAKYLARGVSWSERSKELDGGFFVKITPALTYDTRDSALNARHGVLARLTFEENLGVSGNTFGKLHGMIRSFSPLGKKSSIVFTGKAGGKIHGNMPDYAGFALGGPYTIRGFNISEVGVGDGYMMGSAEVRVPIPFIDRLTSNSFLNNLRIAGFVDAGTIFSKTTGTYVYNKPGYAITAGVGLRVFIPGLGPINLDYGIPLTNTGGMDRKSGFFTFGMGEMY